jgi:hypothetical protein
MTFKCYPSLLVVTSLHHPQRVSHLLIYGHSLPLFREVMSSMLLGLLNKM